MKLIEVNQQTCNQDGICAAVCPAGLIDFQKGQCPTPVSEAARTCIRCGHCVAVCPTGSLSHCKIPMKACTPIRADLQLSAEQCEQFLRSRRSIRVYRDKSVPNKKLSKLIEMARYAPSGYNSQCVEWLVLDKREELQGLARLVSEWMKCMIENMSDIASSLHLDIAVRRWENGDDVILRGAPVVIIAHARKDNIFAPVASTIALAHLELAAPSLDLGCCWAGYFHAAASNFEPMLEALSLPEGHRCFGAMMVGYPKYTYHRLPLRKSPSITWR